MNNYSLLCSGFLSTTSNRLIHDKYVSDPFIDLVLDKDYLKSNNLDNFNKDVKMLFNNFRENKEIIKDFDFREKIIKTAFQCFNSMSFANWIEIQSKADTTGNLHNLFMEETLLYLSGIPRKVTNYSWIRLLTSDRKTDPVKFDTENWYKENNNKFKVKSFLMQDVIKVWLLQPDGFIDLLISLAVIFGDRPYILDVNSKQRER